MIPSPHDIEISHEESTSASGPLDTLSQNFYQSQPRTPVLCLARLRIGSDCISSKNGRVDLKKLQKASPGLFPKIIKLTGTKKGDVVGKGGDTTAKGKGSHLDYKKKEKKTAVKKEDVKKKEIKVKINSDGSSSSDDSDSDLEELRKKIMKPSLFKDTKPSTSNQSSASGNTLN